jgi:hypothetical protein
VPRRKTTNGSLGPLRGDAAMEALRDAQASAMDGAMKLAHAVELLRTGLETIVRAEVDNDTRLPVSVKDLKTIAVGALDAYSAHAGQDWKRHPLIGSRAGDRSNAEGYNGG